MNNPHAERQAVLLERITKNADKCTELILELNHCVEEIIQANAYVKLAALLATKYSRNAQYNLEVTPEVLQTSASDVVKSIVGVNPDLYPSV